MIGFLAMLIGMQNSGALDGLPGRAEPPGTVVGVDHVQLSLPDGDEAVAEADAFYVGLLGLELLVKPPPVAGRGGRWYGAGSTSVHLGVDRDFTPARTAHPGLLVDDIPAIMARLEDAGHPCTPDDTLPGVPRAYVDDPFGNRIELLEPPGTVVPRTA